MCWGRTRMVSTARTIFPLAAPVPSAVAVSAGAMHTCTAGTDGRVHCWGDNESRQLGNGTDATRMEPLPVGGISDAVDVASGRDFTCALHTGGTASCWGRVGGTTSITPQLIAGVSDGVAIFAGDYHACVLRTGGAVVCWGKNSNGQLGRGTSTFREDVASPPSGLPPLQSLSLGGEHSCGVTGTGEAWCWGYNFYGQAGTGSTSSRILLPTVLPFVTTVQEIAAGERHTCLLLGDGTLRCFGSNTDYQTLATSNPERWPTSDPGLTNVRHVAAGARTTLTLGTMDEVFGFGSNTYYMLMVSGLARTPVRGAW